MHTPPAKHCEVGVGVISGVCVNVNVRVRVAVGVKVLVGLMVRVGATVGPVGVAEGVPVAVAVGG